MSTAVETAPFLRLSVDQGSSKNPNAAVMVRWELSDEALKRIVDDEVRDPHVMLVVVNNNKELEGTRVTRPLGDAMARLEIPKAGTSTIFGMIVYRRSDTKKTARYFMRLEEGDFLHRAPKGQRALTLQIDEYANRIDEDRINGGENYRMLRDAQNVLYKQREALSRSTFESYIEFDSYLRMGTVGKPSSHEVTISAGAVSKKHPIVDGYCRLLPWWWDKNVRNNCERRNRVMVTSALSPIWLPVGAVLGSLAAVGAALYWTVRKLLMLVFAVVLTWLGTRQVKYTNLWNLRELKALSLLDEEGEDLSSYWVTKRVPDKTASSGYRLIPRALILRMINPITIVLGALAVVFAMTFTGNGLLTVAIPVVLIGVSWGLSDVFASLGFAKGSSKSEKISFNKVMLEHDLSSLVYDPSNAPAEAKFSALPKEKRTFHQWLLSLKQVVCKPIER